MRHRELARLFRGLLLAGARLLGDVFEEVADMDHAARIVERLVEDRQARMPGGAEMRQQLVERGFGGDGDDIGTRNHDIIDATLAQAQHIAEHRALLRREIAQFTAFLCQGLDDLLAGSTAAAQAETIEELAEPVAQATAVGFAG